MTKILELVQGKKTYIVAGLTALAAGADVLGYHVPEGVYALLAAFFGITIRHAISTNA